MKKKIILVLSFMFVMLFFAIPIKSEAATSTSQAGIVEIGSGRLNVRSSNSTNSTIITSLPKGNYVTLIEKSGNWWKVEYDYSKYGYCHADYINTVSSNFATVNITSGTLNVRSGRGTSYNKVGTLYNREAVLVLDTQNGWSKVIYNGTKTGYVSSKYLSVQLGYNAISLKVPNYKQTDSRWANVKIGTSGKTIGQIGCVTTAISMIESYRTGTTIYPDAMSKKLSYSSSGNVYWPSNYKTVTSSAGYLNGIYNQLKNGKPVILGAKNYSGTQHWVVVTGFKDGNSLTASAFTINDPGSNSRITLQQFLNQYPVFYKYLYY